MYGKEKRMKRVNVILETELYDKARVVGFIRKKSLSEIVRDALRDWLTTNVDEKAELVLSEKDERRSSRSWPRTTSSRWNKSRKSSASR